MEGLEKLEAEVLEMNNCNISIIFDYIKTRTDLYEKFNNKEKSIHQMYEFIYEKAKKQKIDNVAMISDKVVYLWAVTYFLKSNDELGIKEKSSHSPTSNKKAETDNKKNSTQNLEETKVENNQITLFQEVRE